jgi:hypothetical protein
MKEQGDDKAHHVIEETLLFVSIDRNLHQTHFSAVRGCMIAMMVVFHFHFSFSFRIFDRSIFSFFRRKVENYTTSLKAMRLPPLLLLLATNNNAFISTP